ncbi:hypothetical protein BN1723_007187 [Verticillium longisporum]|uniref:Ketoreductase domain-containing protein n=1 Tax=Verticillium longisporum TaxID=100787 RepID=A0A0G4NJS8_VERLO|nr:hypothetical protein BN1723_007187 [Verticillium longisporum]
MSKVWFITGTSRGLGRALVDHALAQGDKVVATARNPKALEPLQAQYPDTLFLYPLDVTDASAARAAVAAALDKFDHIDILVNNAGYANVASVEHMADDDFRAQVDTNFFGVVNVTKAVLPHFRARRAGHVFQVSSIASRSGTPGLSAYQASKFAVSGFSISLASEVAPFNVKVTSLEPGAMQTDWMGSSMKVHDIDEAYRETVGSIAGHVGNLESGGVAASGGSDIAKIGAVIETLYKADDPPVRVLLGKDAVNYGLHFSQQQADIVEASSLPPFDFKHAAVQRIDESLPDRAAETTRVWAGFYPSNTAYGGAMKFAPLPGSDVYAWTQSSRQDAVFRLPATFPPASVGGAVEGYLEAGPTTLGIVAVVITDNLNMTDVVKVWQVVPGQVGVCLDSGQFPERHQLFPGDTMT